MSTTMVRRVLLSWSSGKDSAWTLHVLRQQPDVEVVGLLTTFNEAADRVAMHAVRRALVDAQALAAGLPLWPVPLPAPCSNAEYEQRMSAVIERARDESITHVAFGDLFLEDVRTYRIRQLSGTGVEPLFPLWGSAADTPGLAQRMLNAGLRAVLTCVDPKQLPGPFVGRSYDAALLPIYRPVWTHAASVENSIPSASGPRNRGITIRKRAVQWALAPLGDAGSPRRTLGPKPAHEMPIRRPPASGSPGSCPRSLFEFAGAGMKEPLPVVYSRAYPPEYFDVIAIDECHRSIYSLSIREQRHSKPKVTDGGTGTASRRILAGKGGCREAQMRLRCYRAE